MARATSDLGALQRHGPPAPRRRYATPRLAFLLGADELLAALGPAQAHYGGNGLVP